MDGVASVDESAITGESAPVIREAGGDRSAVTGGTRVLSDEIVVKITAAPGESFLDKMIALVEGASRRKTPNEVALSILLSSLTIIFVLAVATLAPMAAYAGQPQPLVVLIALLVCLIPTTIGALLSAIGIAGHGPAGPQQRAGHVRAGGRGGRGCRAPCCWTRPAPSPSATGRRPSSCRSPASTADRLRDAARWSSLADQTPEGRSIVTLALAQGADDDDLPSGATFVEFSAHTRMSGVDLAAVDRLEAQPADPQGRGSAVVAWLGCVRPTGWTRSSTASPASGGTPLVVAERMRRRKRRARAWCT